MHLMEIILADCQKWKLGSTIYAYLIFHVENIIKIQVQYVLIMNGSTLCYPVCRVLLIMLAFIWNILFPILR